MLSTGLLMRAQNFFWKHRLTIHQISVGLPRVFSLTRARRAQFTGHCHRAENEVASSLLKARDRKLSFPNIISRDAGIDRQNLGRSGVVLRSTHDDDTTVWRCLGQILAVVVIYKR